MKKYSIWILTVVMGCTFGILIYFQGIYMSRMTKMRRQQFTENVMKAMHGVSSSLEREETMFYLEQDASLLDASYYDSNVYDETKSSSGISVSSGQDFISEQRISARYKRLQDALRTKYRYQQSLLNEIIINIMQESGSRPVEERVDSTFVREYLTKELANFGINIPFAFGVTTEAGHLLYSVGDFDTDTSGDIYSILLFPNSDTPYKLLVQFPTEENFIYKSVRFLIPTFFFTLVLFGIFIYTIISTFRQRKLTEMKNDFVNNMTHEIKTPISTISLAAQMLADPAMAKSPTMLEHLGKVIGDESKRLRMLVERVLLLSMFDNSKISLNLKDVNVNKTIESIANNFKIRAEKEGGTIILDLKAAKDTVAVDEMHFTNVLYNLFDNALKYKKENVAPKIAVITRDLPDQKKIEIEISDNGLGIKRDDLKRIFERFYRVSTGNRHDIKGFGIGLSYVRQVVEKMAGSIKVESEYGSGTKFVITLPLTS